MSQRPRKVVFQPQDSNRYTHQQDWSLREKLALVSAVARYGRLWKKVADIMMGFQEKQRPPGWFTAANCCEQFRILSERLNFDANIDLKTVAKNLAPQLQDDYHDFLQKELSNAHKKSISKQSDIDFIKYGEWSDAQVDEAYDKFEQKFEHPMEVYSENDEYTDVSSEDEEDENSESQESNAQSNTSTPSSSGTITLDSTPIRSRDVTEEDDVQILVEVIDLSDSPVKRVIGTQPAGYIPTNALTESELELIGQLGTDTLGSPNTTDTFETSNATDTFETSNATDTFETPNTTDTFETPNASDTFQTPNALVHSFVEADTDFEEIVIVEQDYEQTHPPENEEVGDDEPFEEEKEDVLDEISEVGTIELEDEEQVLEVEEDDGVEGAPSITTNATEEEILNELDEVFVTPTIVDQLKSTEEIIPPVKSLDSAAADSEQDEVFVTPMHIDLLESTEEIIPPVESINSAATVSEPAEEVFVTPTAEDQLEITEEIIPPVESIDSATAVSELGEVFVTPAVVDQLEKTEEIIPPVESINSTATVSELDEEVFVTPAVVNQLEGTEEIIPPVESIDSAATVSELDEVFVTPTVVDHLESTEEIIPPMESIDSTTAVSEISEHRESTRPPSSISRQSETSVDTDSEKATAELQGPPKKKRKRASRLQALFKEANTFFPTESFEMADSNTPPERLTRARRTNTRVATPSTNKEPETPKAEEEMVGVIEETPIAKYLANLEKRKLLFMDQLSSTHETTPVDEKTDIPGHSLMLALSVEGINDVVTMRARMKGPMMDTSLMDTLAPPRAAVPLDRAAKTKMTQRQKQSKNKLLSDLDNVSSLKESTLLKSEIKGKGAKMLKMNLTLGAVKDMVKSGEVGSKDELLCHLGTMLLNQMFQKRVDGEKLTKENRKLSRKVWSVVGGTVVTNNRNEESVTVVVPTEPESSGPRSRLSSTSSSSNLLPKEKGTKRKGRSPKPNATKKRGLRSSSASKSEKAPSEPFRNTIGFPSTLPRPSASSSFAGLTRGPRKLTNLESATPEAKRDLRSRRSTRGPL